MQILKQDIRDNILKAAFQEFSEKGFEKSSMNSIASNAGITVGNMYRYFKNKNRLFSVVVDPVYKKIKDLIVSHTPSEWAGTPASTPLEIEIADLIAKIYSEHRTVLLILLNGSTGSEYERAKEELVQLIEERLGTSLLPLIRQRSESGMDPLFPRIMAVSFWEGMTAILKASADIHCVKKLSQHFIQLYFKNIEDRF